MEKNGGFLSILVSLWVDIGAWLSFESSVFKLTTEHIYVQTTARPTKPWYGDDSGVRLGFQDSPYR